MIEIRFETFQLVSFVLACSLFFYMSTRYIRWLIKESKPKERKLLSSK